MNWSQGDGFSSVGVRMGAIKLAMAGTQDWWHLHMHCWVVDSIWLGGTIAFTTAYLER